jgi:hypothetical protein
LFRFPHQQPSFYDIAPDGQRFLIEVHDEDAAMTMVVNWMEELKRN